MVKNLAILVLFALLSACSINNYPKAKEITKITVKLDSTQGCNFASLVRVNFIAETTNKNVFAVNNQIEFRDSTIYYYPNSINLHINLNPLTHSDSVIHVVYRHVDAETWDSFPLKLDYNENIYFNLNGKNASDNPKTKESFLSALVNLSAGSDGYNGKKGLNAQSAKIFIWKEVCC